MERKKEIEKAAREYMKSDAVSPMNMQLAYGDFINGAEWADKTMIDKACEWLKKEMRVEDCGECDRLVAADYGDLEEFLKDFCEAISSNL